MLAAAGAGLYPDLESACQTMRGRLATFTPAMAEEVRAARLAGWKNALSAA